MITGRLLITVPAVLFLVIQVNDGATPRTQRMGRPRRNPVIRMPISNLSNESESPETGNGMSEEDSKKYEESILNIVKSGLHEEIGKDLHAICAKLKQDNFIRRALEGLADVIHNTAMAHDMAELQKKA